ncbi:SWIM zinc finger family protein [Candidatus Sumerlaeota bacterium]|nr:SWIM zinc finger family protein [Candidatus Sumerlaeota bacterium]
MARWRRRSYYYYDSYFPRSVPREAKGGIKAQSKKGGFGQSWWAKRWIAVLESFNIGARLGRGRSYARQGQVLNIHIDKGEVTAQVQGSRPKPYQVKIKVKTLSPANWAKLAKVFSQQAIFAAKLLAGEMPDNIEDAFKAARLSLFPSALRDLETDCSCPDWSNPCKHIAAVYYLLGEEFDRDPFLILRMRGIERETLIALLGEQTAKKGKKAVSQEAAASAEAAPPAVSQPRPEPLPADPAAFWNRPSSEDVGISDAVIPPVAAALVKRLGKFPFWRGEEDFLPTLEDIYRRASQTGLNTFLGEQPTPSVTTASGK